MNVLQPRLRIPQLNFAKAAPPVPARESGPARTPLKARAPRSARPLARERESLSREPPNSAR